jgi:hypothetical protein
MGSMIAIWDHRLAMGNSAIDAEHRLVLNLLNELAVAASVDAPRLVVEKALETLVRITDRHFARDGQVRVPNHVAFAQAVHRLLDDWRNRRLARLDRRALLRLGQRWLGHMGRHETPDQAPPIRLALVPPAGADEKVESADGGCRLQPAMWAKPVMAAEPGRRLFGT